MSFIRYAQSGQYVDISGGSNHYLYDDGNKIGNYTYGEFAAMIAEVVDEISYDARGNIKHEFADYFGGYDKGYGTAIPRPERAEIFCQCVDKRIDELELTEELHGLVEQWVDGFDAERECAYCGKTFYPSRYNDATEYVCDDTRCGRKAQADRWGVDAETMRRIEQIENELIERGYDFTEAVEYAADYTQYCAERNV